MRRNFPSSTAGCLQSNICRDRHTAFPYLPRVLLPIGENRQQISVYRMGQQHPLVTVESLLLIAAGGALGANVRYLVGLGVAGLSGTFLANVTGCFLLGFLVYERRYTDYLAQRSRLLFGTGFLSSYTTYSTFALEAALASPLASLGYILVSYAVGILAVLVGRKVALQIAGGAAAGETV